MKDVAPQLPEDASEVTRLLAAHAADALYMMDIEGYVTWMNPAAEKMFGWSREEMEGRTLHEAIHYHRPDGRPFPMAECPLGQVMSSGMSAVNHEDTFIHRDGSLIPVYCSNAPVLTDGRITGAALVVHDLSARRRAEHEVRRQAEFEQQLIGIVSHDLRNPLNAITLGTASLLRREDLDPRTTKAVTRIQTSAERAIRLVRDLLDFTQARMGGSIPIQCKPLDLHLLAHQVVDELQMSYPERDLRVRHEGEARGEWDSDRLAQVMNNLISNAVKYSAPETPVTVVTRGEGPLVAVAVHNEGTPIPPEAQAHLFEPMQRGMGFQDPLDRSVGLGLYIVKHIVEAHGGVVHVESTAEAGTTFTARLPRRRG